MRIHTPACDTVIFFTSSFKSVMNYWLRSNVNLILDRYSECDCPSGETVGASRNEPRHPPRKDKLLTCQLYFC